MKAVMKPAIKPIVSPIRKVIIFIAFLCFSEFLSSLAMRISKIFFQRFYSLSLSNTLDSLEFERYSCTSSIAVEYQHFLLRLFSLSSQKAGPFLTLPLMEETKHEQETKFTIYILAQQSCQVG